MSTSLKYLQKIQVVLESVVSLRQGMTTGHSERLSAVTRKEFPKMVEILEGSIRMVAIVEAFLLETRLQDLARLIGSDRVSNVRFNDWIKDSLSCSPLCSLYTSVVVVKAGESSATESGRDYDACSVKDEVIIGGETVPKPPERE